MSSLFRQGHFAGSLIGRRHVSGLTLAVTEYEPRFSVAQHAHEHALLCFVLDGGFTERSGSSRTTCESGTVLFQPRDEPHAHDFHAAGARCFNIQFGSNWDERMELLGLWQPGMPITAHRSRVGWLAQHLYDEFRTPDSASVLSVEGYVLAMLGEIARSRASAESTRLKPAWLIRAVDYLHANFQRECSLTAIAQLAGVDPTHLARTFRRHYHCTMSEYVRRRRVERARELLAHGTESLSGIAYTCGFTDQAHFSRVFKAQTGVTPGSFRKAIGR